MVFKWANILKDNPKKAASFLVLFYSIGIIGLILPYTFPWFAELIPFALLLSLFFLLIFHQQYSGKTIAIFFLIYFAGLSVEIIGVNTGLVFGNYTYGNSLGIKLFDTPVMIGINWLLLVYLTSSVTEKIQVKPLIRVIFASILMLLFDVVIEQVAPTLQMWFWQNNKIPLKNYTAWFILALIFHTLLKYFKVKTENKIAQALFICLWFFFFILWIKLKL